MLRLPPFAVERPADLERALEALGGPTPPRVLAGGTDLLVALKHGHRSATALLSLARLPLRGITPHGRGWTIAAGTPLADLVKRTPQGPLGALPRAAALVAAPPLRSRGTIGGNLCLDTRCAFYNQSAFWRSGRPPCHKAGGSRCYAVPGSKRCHACHQADLPPLLIALGAEVEVASRGKAERRPAADLYSGSGAKPLCLEPSELVTRIFLPPPPPTAGAAYQKVRARAGLDFPAASAAVYLERGDDGCCRNVRVVVGAVASGPLRVAEAEQALAGSRLEPEALEAATAAARREARPVPNADFTPAYRRKVVGTLVVRAARRAWEEAGQEDVQP